MESNQSQTLESPIAMAAEFPESDKARTPSLPSRPGPPLPSPSSPPSLPGATLAACSDGLITVKNKEMKGSPIGELSAVSSPAWRRGGGRSGRASLCEPRRSCPQLGGSHTPPSPGDTAHTIWRLPKGPRRLAEGDRPSLPDLQPQPHNREAQSPGLFHGL